MAEEVDVVVIGLGPGGDAMGRTQGFLQGIERAGADVAIDNAERRKRQRCAAVSVCFHEAVMPEGAKPADYS